MGRAGEWTRNVRRPSTPIAESANVIMLDPMYIVYCHTHCVSQKRYVGITAKTMLHRWRSHKSDATRRGSPLPFHSAIRKHGPDAFDHEILEQCATLDAANEAEQWWIAHFGSNDRALGYNLDAGGRVHATHPETRRRLSESGLRAWATATADQLEARRRAVVAALAAQPPEVKRELIARRSATCAARTPEQKAASEARRLGSYEPERRSTVAKLREAAKTPEQRRSMAMAAVAAVTAEQRREIGMAGQVARDMAMTPERKREISAFAIASITPEQRAKQGRTYSAAWAAKSPEERESIIARRREGLLRRNAQRRAGSDG